MHTHKITKLVQKLYPVELSRSWMLKKFDVVCVCHKFVMEEFILSTEKKKQALK